MGLSRAKGRRRWGTRARRGAERGRVVVEVDGREGGRPRGVVGQAWMGSGSWVVRRRVVKQRPRQRRCLVSRLGLGRSEGVAAEDAATVGGDHNDRGAATAMMGQRIGTSWLHCATGKHAGGGVVGRMAKRMDWSPSDEAMMSDVPMSMSTHAAGNLDLAWTSSWIWRGWKRDTGNFLCPVSVQCAASNGVGSPIELPVGEGRRELRRGAGAETTSRCGWQHLGAREVLFVGLRRSFFH